MTNPTRGERNNNPGNIDRTADRWQGVSSEQTDPRFISFTAPEWGIRAMAKILMHYQNTEGDKTIAEMINRWAPPAENVTSAYVTDVAEYCGVDPSANYPLTLPNLTKLVWAIIRHENGRVSYTDQQIAAGIQLALGQEVKVADEQTVMVPMKVTMPAAASAAPKPGIQKSEFWVTAVGMIMPLAQTLTGHMDPTTASAIMAAVGGVYTACRSVIYALHAAGLAKTVPDLPAQQGVVK